MRDLEIVTLRFPAKAEYLILARLALAGVAQARGLDVETLADLKLAVTEACSNVVRHAYRDDAADAIVTVSIELHKGAIVLRVSDEGIGFVPDLVGDGLEAGLRDVSSGGMGLSIIRALADDVEITSGRDGRGTSLRLEKRLSVAPDRSVG